MTTIQHGKPCGLRSEMTAAEKAGKSAVFLCHGAAKCLARTQGGGCGMAKLSNAAKPLSSICLSWLYLCTVTRPDTLRTREVEKDESDPPQNRGVM